MSTQNPNTPSALPPGFRMTYKRMIKIERIARLTLDARGFSNQEIANHLKCHVVTITQIKQLPEFHAKMLELKSGVLSAYDAELRSSIETSKQELRDMVPTALNVIRDAALGKLGTQAQLRAAEAILDREGSLAKVSKTSVTVTEVPNMKADPTLVGSLMSLLAGAPKINNEFSSPAARGADAQERAGQRIDSNFTIETGINADKLLDSIDTKDKKPN